MSCGHTERLQRLNLVFNRIFPEKNLSRFFRDKTKKCRQILTTHVRGWGKATTVGYQCDTAMIYSVFTAVWAGLNSTVWDSSSLWIGLRQTAADKGKH